MVVFWCCLAVGRFISSRFALRLFQIFSGVVHLLPVAWALTYHVPYRLGLRGDSTCTVQYVYLQDTCQYRRYTVAIHRVYCTRMHNHVLKGVKEQTHHSKKPLDS